MASLDLLIAEAVQAVAALNNAGAAFRRAGEVERAEVCFSRALALGEAMGETEAVREDRRLAELIAATD